VLEGGDLSKEAARSLVHYIMSLLEPRDRRELRREFALAFMGDEPPERDSKLPVVRELGVRRHPWDDR
jgi:predicted DNA-binding transcriptional regulator YafY